MKTRTLLGIGVAACVLILATSQVLSQEEKAKPAGPPEQGQMTEEMMAWCKAATPGPNHKQLNYCVGKWDVACRQWMEPDAPASESKAICENRWVLGGRYVETRYSGKFMGMPYDGIGFGGYDNVQESFFSVWMDNMSTGAFVEQGTYDPTKKEFTYTGEMTSPMGGTIKSKTICRLLNNDEYVMVMYHQPPDAEKMSKFMELTYKRIAGGTATRPE
jgi:hypothetical protein